MKLGYARVSTEDQAFRTATPPLARRGMREMFEEKVSGAKRDRPQLENS